MLFRRLIYGRKVTLAHAVSFLPKSSKGYLARLFRLSLYMLILIQNASALCQTPIIKIANLSLLTISSNAILPLGLMSNVASTAPRPSKRSETRVPHRVRRERDENLIRNITSARRAPPRSYVYTCTLCWQTFPPPCYTVGSDARTVCIECWKWMYDISVCWSCGTIVYRKTDAVSFGWC